MGIDTALTSQAPEASALAASQNAATRGWSGVLGEHVKAWSDLWKSDITVGNQPDLQDWIRANLYDLWSSIRAGTDDSISPVGLSSDNYAGLIFWDAETWMYPSLLLMHPDIAESVDRVPPQDAPGRAEQRAASTATRARSSRGTAPAPATSTRSATAGTRLTASPRSTCRETSHSPSGSTTSPPATRTG